MRGYLKALSIDRVICSRTSRKPPSIDSLPRYAVIGGLIFV